MDLLRIWKFRFLFDGFFESEILDLFEEFGGAVERLTSSTTLSSVSHKFVRVKEWPLKVNYDKIPKKTRHKSGSLGNKYFSDGTRFNVAEQNRSIGCVYESDDVSCYCTADNCVISTNSKSIVFGTMLRKYFLSDIVENIMLSCARQNNWIQCHGSAWIRNGISYIATGNSGIGKTTTLFEHVKDGASFLSNDRIFLKLENNKLYALSFPLPVNIGCGTIRSIGLKINHFSFDNDVKIRLTAQEIAKQFSPNYVDWFEVGRVYSSSLQECYSNIYWDQDSSHPFWNRSTVPVISNDNLIMKKIIEDLIEVIPMKNLTSDVARYPA